MNREYQRRHSPGLNRLPWGRGVGNALREWDGWAHDRDCRRRMLTLYIDGHD
ncbi:MAG TPA: hypothetical protein VF591_25045 [Pyrinomonadaceae bacterium]|jgi:esterase/lipase superfamily enzyme